MGVVVCDSTRSSTQDTLASEVVAAIAVLKWRFRHSEFVNHRTIPVSAVSSSMPRVPWLTGLPPQIIVYSFHHDESARITQAYWDGTALVIRQSRQLDLRGPEPTSDAYLLLRWMANKPVGATAYERPQDTNGLGGSETPPRTGQYAKRRAVCAKG